MVAWHAREKHSAVFTPVIPVYCNEDILGSVVVEFNSAAVICHTLLWQFYSSVAGRRGQMYLSGQAREVIARLHFL